eukprot:6161469-Pleurochrysis_carterae.AAC.1
MSARKRLRIASLKRCAMFDAGWVPNPIRRRSDTKNNVLPLSPLCAGGVWRTSNCWMNTILSFHQSSGAIAS